MFKYEIISVFISYSDFLQNTFLLLSNLDSYFLL